MQRLSDCLLVVEDSTAPALYQGSGSLHVHCYWSHQKWQLIGCWLLQQRANLVWGAMREREAATNMEWLSQHVLLQSARWLLPDTINSLSPDASVYFHSFVQTSNHPLPTWAHEVMLLA